MDERIDGVNAHHFVYLSSLHRNESQTEDFGICAVTGIKAVSVL